MLHPRRIYQLRQLLSLAWHSVLSLGLSKDALHWPLICSCCLLMRLTLLLLLLLVVGLGLLLVGMLDLVLLQLSWLLQWSRLLQQMVSRLEASLLQRLLVHNMWVLPIDSKRSCCNTWQNSTLSGTCASQVHARQHASQCTAAWS